MPAAQRFVLQDGAAIAARGPAFDALADYFRVSSSEISATGPAASGCGRQSISIELVKLFTSFSVLSGGSSFPEPL